MSQINQYFFNEFKMLLSEKAKKTIHLNFKEIILETLERNNLQESDLDNLNEIKDWFNKVYHQSYIDDLLKMYDANEFIIHSPSDIEVQKKDHLNLKVEFLSNEDFVLSLAFLTQKLGIDWNFNNPFASFKNTRLVDGNEIDLRVSITHPCLSPKAQAKAFLRVHAKENFKISDFSKDKETHEIVEKLVSDYKNIVIAGSTASGKTSFLRVCKALCFENEHHVIIEDVAEIDGDISNSTHLLSHPSEGKSLKDYCSYALRMSPKRILLGEIRSSEVIPFLLAMNTGHKGMMSTIHANSAKDTLLRLTTLFSIFSESKNGIDFDQILRLICQSVDNVIFVENKEVKEIIEVHGSEADRPIYSTLYSKAKKITDHQRGLSTHEDLGHQLLA
ncbi:ATPase, T2SS/T4P/T4SS family [Halobacteriovorax sp. XZX-3]|uniref:ATPase, T2SS/T4P/T4SS family n=1 Tax=unclassified Halobacteriovorax TaxID=2639665 RepID=UPI00371E9041